MLLLSIQQIVTRAINLYDSFVWRMHIISIHTTWELVDDDRLVLEMHPFNSSQYHMWTRCMYPSLAFHDANRYSHNLPVFWFHWETSLGRPADAPGRLSRAMASNHQYTQTHIQHPSILLSPSCLPSPWTAPLCQDTQGHEEQGIMVEHLPTVRDRLSEGASVKNSTIWDPQRPFALLHAGWEDLVHHTL